VHNPAVTIADPAVAGSAACPTCGGELISQRGAQVWCGACEWGLDRYEPERRRPELAFGWQDRLAFRMAYRQNLRQFRAVAAIGAKRPGFSWESAFVIAFSLLMLAIVVAMTVFGVYLTCVTFFAFRTLGGILLILLAVLLRPRFGRLSKAAHQLSPERAPELFRLIGDVAAATGAKQPHVVIVNPEINAFTTSYGLRRRRLLCIGLPLWASLRSQERVALLGHELAHFVNGDVRRGPLTSLAFTTLHKLSVVTTPGGVWRRGPGGLVAELVTRVFMRVTHEFFVLAQTVVTALALRSSQRAEYYADAVATRVAGSEGAAGLLDVLLVAGAMPAVLRSSLLRGEDARGRLASVDAARSQLAPMMPGLRQLSLRDHASLFRSHPPTGLRERMVKSGPALEPQVVLTAEALDRIDHELAAAYRHVMR
jgi:heat shock protein HtpX